MRMEFINMMIMGKDLCVSENNAYNMHKNEKTKKKTILKEAMDTGFSVKWLNLFQSSLSG